jgi:hypothetical protein
MTAGCESGGQVRCGSAFGILLHYLGFGGIVAAAFLLMKCAVAVQLLGAVAPPDF